MTRQGPGRQHNSRDVERAYRHVLTAARKAAAASTNYHYIRTLGGLARWTLMDPVALDDPPQWALRLREWEGGFYGGGASRAAGMRCLRTSADYHLAYAHFNDVAARAATSPFEASTLADERDKQLAKAVRARHRHSRALRRARGEN